VSLFNKASAAFTKSGGLAGLTSGLNSALGKAGAGLASALGGGSLGGAVAGIGETMARNAVQGAINDTIPAAVRNALGAADGALSDLAHGDWNAAGLHLLDAGLLDGVLGSAFGGARSSSRFMGSKTPLLGGITPKEAIAIYQRMRAETLAKKNLFMVEVANAAGVVEGKFNLFATEVEYAPHTVSGEKRRVGAATVDAVTGGEPTDIRIVTLDDAAGTLKNWFARQSAMVENDDGTVGLPAQYAVRIRVMHGVVSASQKGGYEDKGLFRPASIEFPLSRREDGMQELQMSFTQLDTFMK
jgi:hypothetical protein